MRLNEHMEHDCGLTVFQHACQLGCEGIVSSASARAIVLAARPTGSSSKNPAAPAVKREAEEDWGR